MNFRNLRFGNWKNQKLAITGPVDVRTAILYDGQGHKLLEHNFPAIHMANGDSLELKWTLDCTGSGLFPSTRKQIDLNEWTQAQDHETIISTDPEMDEKVKEWYDRL